MGLTLLSSGTPLAMQHHAGNMVMEANVGCGRGKECERQEESGTYVMRVRIIGNAAKMCVRQ